MNHYISSNSAEQARLVRDAILATGHQVVSQWHDEPDPDPNLDDRLRTWTQRATTNVDIIRNKTDILVLIACEERGPGGKFIEAGVAIGKGKVVIVIGHIENNMLFHPLIQRYHTIKEYLSK